MFGSAKLSVDSKLRVHDYALLWVILICIVVFRLNILMTFFKTWLIHSRIELAC